MARYPEVATSSPKERKPGKIKRVEIDLLDDDTYQLCAYDENHMKTVKMSAQNAKDVMAKFTGMMGKTIEKAKDVMGEADDD